MFLEVTGLELPFCFVPTESPFLPRASNMKKLPKGYFSNPFSSWKKKRIRRTRLNTKPFKWNGRFQPLDHFFYLEMLCKKDNLNVNLSLDIIIIKLEMFFLLRIVLYYIKINVAFNSLLMFNPFAHVCCQIKGCKKTTLLNALCKLLTILQLFFVFQKSNIC